MKNSPARLQLRLHLDQDSCKAPCMINEWDFHRESTLGGTASRLHSAVLLCSHWCHHMQIDSLCRVQVIRDEAAAGPCCCYFINSYLANDPVVPLVQCPLRKPSSKFSAMDTCGSEKSFDESSSPVTTLASSGTAWVTDDRNLEAGPDPIPRRKHPLLIRWPKLSRV